ncbi:MAG: secretin N-terminal domain-containing protein, partial [Proteobacteria bacterium]|nr:secretin N-terminal domain-containing protein [Pseudomonadota bacterium]
MFKKLITGFTAAAILAGCATSIPRGEATRASIEAALDEAALPPVTPAEVAAALLPEVGVELPDPAANNERFDVDTDKTPARTFFMALVKGTPYNMVVHPDVSGKISLSMKSVTVPQVLEAVSDVYGYAVRETRTGFVVLPAAVQSRIFQIDYLNLQRSGISRTRVSFGAVSTGARGSSRSGQDGSAAPQRGTSQAGSGIETIYEADFWTELQETLEQIVGTDKDHQVVVNAQSGVIVVRAMPEKLRHVEEYLEIVQGIAQRQVIIEAKIIEVQLSDGFQAGINWVAVAQNSRGDTYTFGQHTPPTGFGGDIEDLGGEPILVQPGEVTTGFINTAVGGAFTMAFDIGDFNSFIELLEAQGETRVLSSPRVSTLNNQKAVIKL